MAKQSEHEQWLSSRFPGGVPAVPDWSDVRMAYEAGRINGEFAASTDRQELLEALQAFANAAEEPRGAIFPDDYERELERARAAIAKATGA